MKNYVHNLEIYFSRVFNVFLLFFIDIGNIPNHP